jgi:elongation factor 1 alpha-like protein
MPVSNVFRGGAGGLSSGLGISGRILTGMVQVGERVCVLPGDETAIVRSTCHFFNAHRKINFNARLTEIEFEDNSVPWASAGTNITLYLTGIERISIGYAMLRHTIVS